MPVLTIREIYDAARAAGFGEREAVTWTAVALAETGGQADAENLRLHARAAYALSRQGQSPPLVTPQVVAGTQGDYRTHLPRVEREIGISGAPSLAASTSYDEIDSGQRLDAGMSPWTETGGLRPNQGPLPADADGDGLADVFERLVGTDPLRADTDADGLVDGYEAYVSGTDPLGIDRDLDGATDGFEVGQHSDPLSSGPGGVAVPRWTIADGYQRRLAAVQAQAASQSSQPPAAPAPEGPVDDGPPAGAGPAPDLSGGRVSSDGGEPRLVASLDAAGHGNWQGAVKAGNHWFIGQAGSGDREQIFHRLDSTGKALDQMSVVGAAHVTSFAVLGDTVYATYDGEVVTFPYQPGATISRKDTTPTGWKGYISVDPTHRFAVIRKGNHYRAYDLQTHDPIGQEVITPRGQRQGFSIVGDTLYVLTGKTNAPARVDSFSFTTGKQTGTQDVTGVGPGRHREPEGMFGDLMGVKTGLGANRRLKIYQLDTGIAPATGSEVASPAGLDVAGDTGLGARRSSDPGPVDPGPGDEGSDGDHVKFGGETVDRRTAAMLTEAQRLANVEDPTIGKFKLTQGSFSHSVGASAGTHDGPGAFDMLTQGYSGGQKQTIGLALRKVGFASWLRRESQGPWDEHWHGIAIGTKGLPSIAASQVTSYLDGHNGLRGNGKDTDARPDQIVTWEQYRQAHGSVEEPPQTTPDPVQPSADPSGDRFDIDGGQLLDPGRDSDGDGLTDAFEQLSGTAPGRADTDGDGLLDGYEVGTSRTDPWSIDSDLDGFTDAAELRFGSNPLGSLPLGSPPVGSAAPGSGALDGTALTPAPSLPEHGSIEFGEP